MKESYLYLTVFVLCCLTACGQYKTYDQRLKILYNNTVPLIHPKQLADTLQADSSFIILDCREPKEYKVSHLKGAVNVGYKKFNMDSVKRFSKKATIIVYCTVGYRSEHIGEKLEKAGYLHVDNLYGGIFEWANEDYSVYNMQRQRTDSVHAYSHKWGKWLKKGVKVYD